MTLPIFLRRAAELDLVAIEDWYQSQRQGLGGEFRQAVDYAIALIADSPLAYPERYRRSDVFFSGASPTSCGADLLNTSW